ncbi:crustacean cardioactive peptide precursor [Daphnia pulex]|uniref:Crustacean cardioactive peptide n=1 Tax=Daphnia pulex TaxID=6669 RepID=E9HE05_DAPPU|nr:crustacean cardioactive peptide precursor [Daphnia pulex]|eukprot:EFX70015.1 crustacean cardioactive peptide precursor [Daphnia pulex]
MTRPLFYSLLMLAWMIISLYISASSSQPLKNNQNDSDSAEEIEQWSFKEKRPFCNAFAGCGRKRSMIKDTKHPPYEKAASNHPRLPNADTKLLDKLFAKIQHQRANFVQLDDPEYY